ncbi:MAG: VTT domain-containing protein [Verrucomicrobia bacterium]|nr:VTT domain-containing protein [Verrucomicrobiota bacterium]MDA1065203.1 VTT domain-containing protein [Verrucomicrobiota bacterium]
MGDWINKQKLLVLVGVLFLGALCLWGLLSFTDIGIDDLKSWINFWIEELQTWPALLFFLMVAILPLLGFPISPLVIIASIRFGIAGAIPFVLSALAVNFILAYWISTKLLHNFIQKIVARWNYELPRVKEGDAVKWIFVIRLCGAPLVAQNYVLGLSYVPFWPYLWISMVAQAPIIIGVIIFGDSFFSGNIGKALLGLGLLVVAFIAISYFRKRYAQPEPGSADTAGG